MRQKTSSEGQKKQKVEVTTGQNSNLTRFLCSVCGGLIDGLGSA
jgi:competence CoiA-like predicted nuclease